MEAALSSVGAAQELPFIRAGCRVWGLGFKVYREGLGFRVYRV